jgi:hypothetical protein
MPDRLGQINRQLCCTLVIIQLQWGVQITTVGKWPSFILYHRDFKIRFQVSGVRFQAGSHFSTTDT